jgi:hypothetical protein
MPTDSRGVMVYLPSEVETKIAEYCTNNNITRKDKHGNIITSLGSGVVVYLKSQLLGDIPRTLSNRPNLGLTKDEVLDLIAKSNTSNGLSDRSPAPIDAGYGKNDNKEPYTPNIVSAMKTAFSIALKQLKSRP